jgi:hypothetical protein
MIKYKMIQRRPFPIYDVEFEGKRGTLMKNGRRSVDSSGPLNQRWRWSLVEDENLGEVKFFKSRRAAFCFFETGEKFKTNPVFAVMGGRKGTKRIR